jgi:hypothetical protein
MTVRRIASSRDPAPTYTEAVADEVAPARAADDGVDLSALALLADPVRRRLYELVRASAKPVGREEAAAGAGVSAKFAAFTSTGWPRKACSMARSGG